MKTRKELITEYGSLSNIDNDKDLRALACNFIRMVTWQKEKDLDLIEKRHEALINPIISDIRKIGFDEALNKIKKGDLHSTRNYPYIYNYYGIDYKKQKNTGHKAKNEKHVNKVEYSFPTTSDFKKKIEKSSSKIAGTDEILDNKRNVGRIAEFTALSFLKSVGVECIDVANDKYFHFDILIQDLGVGLEVKNIANGYFYISDNEAKQFESNRTRLCFIDGQNILISKSFNKSSKLVEVIKDLRKIDTYINDNYFEQYEVNDIKIGILEKNKKDFQNDFILINNLHRNQIIDLLKNN